MSRLFDDASNEYLLNNTAILSAIPITMACWFNSNDDALAQVLMSIADNASDLHSFYLRLDGAAGGDPINAAVAGGGDGLASSSSGFSTNTWHHACGVFTSNTSRAIYLDGGNKGTDATDITPAGLDRFGIGVLVRQNLFGYFSGMIAEAAIWNAALTDAEAASLAAGFSPKLIRPQSLVAYWPLVRGLNDPVGGYNLTATGTVVAAHTRIILPSRMP